MNCISDFDMAIFYIPIQDLRFENIDKLEGAFTSHLHDTESDVFENIDKLEGAFTIPRGSISPCRFENIDKLEGAFTA